MCGILIWWKPDRDASYGLFRNGLRLQEHRGPDFTGEKFFDAVWLGHNRLSIIDLSEQGCQPMADDTSRYWITYNGEVYNYVELRTELVGLGYAFRTETDTEVILKAFIEWGDDAFKRFNGMWALAIWDSLEERLVISRDRFGIKPLYYTRIGDSIALASEIKPLLELKGEAPAANHRAISRFFFDGNVDGQSETWFKDIWRFPEAHTLVLQGDKEIWSAYWELSESSVGDESDFDALIGNAVDLCLRSDVPVGVCLSGGVDSSIIATLAEKRQEILSFTARHADKGSDEFPYVEMLAEGRRLKPHSVFPDTDKLFEDASNILWHLEEPAKATGVLSQWQVMRLAHKNVKVLLDGQGGDEVFAGYSFQRWPFLKGLVFSGRWSEANKVIGYWGWGYLWAQLSKEVSDYAKSILRPYVGWVWRLVSGSAKKRMPWTKSFYKNHMKPNFDLVKTPPLRNLKQRLKWDISSEMLPALLRNEDKLAMAFSIETRVPLLDVRLVEYAYSREDTELIKNGWTKYPLREVLSRNAPVEIAWRKDKLGFPTPLNNYLAPFREEIIDCLKTGAVVRHGIVASEKIADTINCAMTDPHNRLVWHLLQTEWWLRNFIDGDFRKPLPWIFK